MMIIVLRMMMMMMMMMMIPFDNEDDDATIHFGQKMRQSNWRSVIAMFFSRWIRLNVFDERPGHGRTEG